MLPVACKYEDNKMAKFLFMGKETFTRGNLPQVGEKLPEASVCTTRLEDISLKDLGGPMILNIFPSIDTSVCAKSMKAFCEQCQSLSSLKLFHISKDLPFTLDRFKQDNKLEAATLSCFRSDLANQWGLEISTGPLRNFCARCVIILDSDFIIQYIELVEELTHEPNYQKAIEAAIEIM
jgi:thiol peroxidase